MTLYPVCHELGSPVVCIYITFDHPFHFPPFVLSCVILAIDLSSIVDWARKCIVHIGSFLCSLLHTGPLAVARESTVHYLKKRQEAIHSVSNWEQTSTSTVSCCKYKTYTEIVYQMHQNFILFLQITVSSSSSTCLVYPFHTFFSCLLFFFIHRQH